MLGLSNFPEFTQVATM